MQAPFLKWNNPQGEETSLPLTGDQAVIGRLSESDVVIMNPYVSRRHARVFREGTDFVVEDLKSTHGTFLNGTQITRQVLNPGDRITLGRDQIQIRFLTEQEQPESFSSGFADQDLQKSVLQLTSVIPLADTEASFLQKISHILDFQYNWERNFSADQTFRQIIDSALQLSGAERGYILLKEDPGFKFVVGMNGQGHLLLENEFRTSQSVVQQVETEGQAVIMTQNIDKAFAEQQSILAMDLRAVACMPLKWITRDSEEADVRGILYLDSTKAMHALTGLDQKILSRLADEAANVFSKLELIEAFEEQKAFEKELALARETQMTLLPSELPRVDGFEIAAFSQPTRHVGGDFYDFLPLRSSSLTGVLADVSGKGISAALLSSLVQGALQVESRIGAPIPEMIQRVNQYLCEKTPSNRFVTLFLFSVDREGKGVYLSAGHNPTYLFRVETGQVDELPSQDMVLGAFAFAQYGSAPLTMQRGDILVVYTDGLSEAMNPRDELFGEERLKVLIREHAANGCKEMEKHIRSAIQDFTEGRAQTDDMTMVIVERI